MKQKAKHLVSRLHPRHVNNLLRTFLKDETISGKLILVAAILALLIVNLPLGSTYENFWQTQFSLQFNGWTLSNDLRHWVNDALMAIFFLVVGLEIKRELVEGELSTFRSAALPIGAALGGMLVPSLIYFSINPSGEAAKGWGVPIATDIAFAVGALALLGSRISSSLKVFLLTLAIADDIGAIVVITVFYAASVNLIWLAVAAVIFLIMMLTNKYEASNMGLFIVLGFGLWLAIQSAGIHGSIAGAIVGFLAPLTPGKTQESSIAERLERACLPVATLIIVPLFVFANAGLKFSSSITEGPGSMGVVLGVVAGLVVGKVTGVLAATWLLVKLKIAYLPKGVRWPDIGGIGLLAGIGFTVSIFIAELAFSPNFQLTEAAKLGIMIGSIVSACLGILVLRKSRARA